MNRDEIIEMARQADFCVSEDGTSISTNNSFGIIQYELEAFAKLVAEKEREALLDTVYSYANSLSWNEDFQADIRSRGNP